MNPHTEHFLAVDRQQALLREAATRQALKGVPTLSLRLCAAAWLRTLAERLDTRPGALHTCPQC